MPCGVFAIFTVVIGVFAEAAEAPSTDLSRDAVAREITEILDRTDLILSTTGKSGAEYFDLLVKYKGRFEEFVTGDGEDCSILLRNQSTKAPMAYFTAGLLVLIDISHPSGLAYHEGDYDLVYEARPPDTEKKKTIFARREYSPSTDGSRVTFDFEGMLRRVLQQNKPMAPFAGGKKNTYRMEIKNGEFTVTLSNTDGQRFPLREISLEANDKFVLSIGVVQTSPRRLGRIAERKQFLQRKLPDMARRIPDEEIMGFFAKVGRSFNPRDARVMAASKRLQFLLDSQEVSHALTSTMVDFLSSAAGAPANPETSPRSEKRRAQDRIRLLSRVEAIES